MIHIVAAYIQYKGWQKGHPIREKLIDAAKRYEAFRAPLHQSFDKNAPVSILNILLDFKTFRSNLDLMTKEASSALLSQFESHNAEDWVQSTKIRLEFFTNSMMPLSKDDRERESRWRDHLVASMTRVILSLQNIPPTSESYDMVEARVKTRIPERTHTYRGAEEFTRLSWGNLPAGMESELRITELVSLPIWSELWFDDPEILIETLHKANGILDIIGTKNPELLKDLAISEGIHLTGLIRSLVITLVESVEATRRFP